ncbi:MAG: FtsX-like permease family protein, partial [Muribaculaceae bacterium]|nr:FtsX-like permease family protein [Muribaculaceae bacterium]
YSISDNDNSTVYNVTSTHQNNISYFTWLSMLDMNVVIILVLMIIVSTFTLISALLMIILERIKMIGLFKALGASNHRIRRIFIYLTHKIIFKSIIIGNVIGIGLALLQQHFHIIKLNPDAYYMNYVPIDINVPMLIFLNVAIIVISYITLIGPSYIISSIKPSSTMRFE